jgi:2-amino-4-hydroxy-6-hydroxymethyldihydropteridine diphosphokinase
MSISNANLSAFRSVAYLGLGSNLQQPVQQIQQALREIDELPEVSLVRVSSMYESAPIGNPNQPAFVNAVAQIETTQSPQLLMQMLLQLEANHHRVRAEKNGPRTLDLDILLFNDWHIHEDHLTLPHPRLHERAFVLLPLLEIAPEIYVPGLARLADYLPTVANQSIRKIAEESVAR